MSQTSIYHTFVTWKGDHLGRIAMGNGPEMDFSAPPDSRGLAGVLTPEDAFVAAVNTCIMMMFLWSCERLKLKLLSYECRAEGTKMIELDHTEVFTQVRLFPEIHVMAGDETPANIEARIQRALKSAQKYSLVANSIKSEVRIDPIIEVSGSSKETTQGLQDHQVLY
jgi:organic hydroperoxide reductase OsmC/OhrA